MSAPNTSSDVTPKARLELSVNPEDGSLLTAPLSTALLAATDGLYTDLYNIAHGELDVTTTTAQQGAADDGEDEDEAAPTITQKKERLSNLSFAQRRHELAWRLVQHGKGLTHVAALTAAAASTDLSNATRVSTRALQHARTAWVQADEAQDALYFFHAQLFPARQSPHDVFGALDLQLVGKWLDMPNDLRLTTDRFHASRESRWSAKEVAERWHIAVRDKLLRGEVAWMRRVQHQQLQLPHRTTTSIRPPLWKVSLKGGIARLTQGSPKQSGSKSVYPIEALLTVLSTATPNEWTLLSVEVRAQPKTGESNHQLEASLRQRYNLHRLCALAMAKEEARFRNSNNQKTDNSDNTNQTTSLSCPAPRPLHRLFQVAHTFALSWQLEILSAQAQALKRGNWAAGDTKPIVVTPVRFFDQNQPISNDKNSNNHNILGVVSMSFWKVDDQYGHPAMGDLHLDGDREQNADDNYDSADPKIIQQRHELLAPPVSNQLTLSIRAEANVGIRVSMSGAQGIMGEHQHHIRATIQELLDAAASPFALSASGALMAATRLCSEQKCHAVVQALMEPGTSAVANESDGVTSRLLPRWMHLTVERTSIAVAARIAYYGIDGDLEGNDSQSHMSFLFRLTCDARTGSFVCTFSRSSSLLRMLACNDIKASESTALRILGLPQRRRHVAGVNAVGRAVRDAFDGLVRSMNALGQRAGVGGAWKDRDKMSASLRQRAIQSACDDAKVSLVKCCGMAAMYGLSALALGVATGITVTHDMAGDAFDKVDGVSLLPAPPLSVLLDHQLIETETQTTDGEKNKQSYIEQTLFAIGCTATADRLTLYPIDVMVHLDTPISPPRRVFCSLVKLKPPHALDMMNGGTVEKPPKKQKLSDEKRKSITPELQNIDAEVEHFAMLLSDALE